MTPSTIQYLDKLRCYFMRSPDAASEIESRLAMQERGKAGRAAGGKATPEQKADRLEVTVASKRSEPKDRTRSKTAKAAKVSERKMGEMLAQTERAKGRGQRGPDGKLHQRSPDVTTGEPTLASFGLTKRESSEAQKLAALPAGRVGHGVAKARSPDSPGRVAGQQATDIPAEAARRSGAGLRRTGDGVANGRQRVRNLLPAPRAARWGRLRLNLMSDLGIPNKRAADHQNDSKRLKYENHHS